jgi:hypothetical protein
MGAIERFLTHGIRFELAAGENVRVIGKLNDSLRDAIMTQKQQLIYELQWNEFESLLAIVAPAYNTSVDEHAEIREAACADLEAALSSYRAMALHIK